MTRFLDYLVPLDDVVFEVCILSAETRRLLCEFCVEPERRAPGAGRRRKPDAGPPEHSEFCHRNNAPKPRNKGETPAGEVIEANAPIRIAGKAIEAGKER